MLISAIRNLKRFHVSISSKKLETGFSMLEAVVVVGVLLALAVGGFLAYGPITENAKVAKVRSTASEVHTAVIVADIDGDPSTNPQDVVDSWNSKADKIKVEILEVIPESAAMSTAAVTPYSGQDFCIQATHLASPHIKAKSGQCDGASSESEAPGSENETPEGPSEGDTTPVVENPPPAEAPPETMYPTAGSVRDPRILNNGTDLTVTFDTDPGYAQKNIAAHALISCKSHADKSVTNYNTLMVTTPYNSIAETANKTFSCGSAQIISYTIKPVTEEGLPSTNNKELFQNLTTNGVLKWDAAEGYTVIGNTDQPVVLNSGYGIKFAVQVAPNNGAKRFSVDYELDCMAQSSARTITKVRGLAGANVYNNGAETHIPNVSCGSAGQVVGYIVKPTTLTSLSTSADISSAGGYTSAGTYEWRAANGYPTVGTVATPVIKGSGSALHFNVNIDANHGDKTFALAVELDCMASSADRTVTKIKKLYGGNVYNNTAEIRPLQANCDSGQIVRYSVNSNTLKAMQESADISNSGGYSAIAAYSWNAADGYESVGTVNSAAINNNGGTVDFKVNIPSGHGEKTFSVYYELNCGGTTHKKLATGTVYNNTAEVRNFQVSCPSGNITGYRLRPTTLADKQNPAIDPAWSGGHTVTGTLSGGTF